MASTGTILYLNGPSSSGRSAVALAIQRTMPEPYLHVGIDDMFEAMDGTGFNRPVFDNTERDDRFGGVEWRISADRRIQSVTFAEHGQRMVRGFHAMVAALASEGNHLIVDDVFFSSALVEDAARRLASLRAYLIGVRCDDVELARREMERGDRIQGIAELTSEAHGLVSTYDRELDTTDRSPDSNAELVRSG